MSGSQYSPLLAIWIPALAALGLAASAFAYDGPDDGKNGNQSKNQPAVQQPATREKQPAPDPETAALAFVRDNHPELAVLLQQLKPMNPAAYQRAVRELALVSRNLAAIKARNPRAYELGLNLWQAKSRVELLTAELASATGPSPELESQLRRAVEDQLESETRQRRFERDQVEVRLKRLKENVDRLESRRDSIIESRYQASVKKGQRARRQKRNGVASSPKRKPKPKAPAKAEVNTEANQANPAATTTKGERQP